MERGSPGFRANQTVLSTRLVPAYARLGDLALAYAQGSMVEGLSETSDIDTVLVWEANIPEKQSRPPASLSDSDLLPRVFDRQETLWISGQEFGVAHGTRAEWNEWIALLEQGEGCAGYPTPVIAAHGLLSGLVLYDPSRFGKELKERLSNFPDRLRLGAATRARSALSSYIESLEFCVQYGDGLLFHGELSRICCLLWIGWFSSQRLYWPLEKRLDLRLRLMGRGDLADMEETVWLGSTLGHRLAAFKHLAEVLLKEMP